MNLPTVFETCEPREDVLTGTIAEADFAADLAKVIRGTASDDYQIAARFFANTYPTAGLKNLLRNVLARYDDPNTPLSLWYNGIFATCDNVEKVIARLRSNENR